MHMKWIIISLTMKRLITLLLLFVGVGFAPAYAEDCAAVGQRVATQQGGKLSEAEPIVQNGRAMCVVVVLVPGEEGDKPRRVEVAVPAN